MISACNLIKKKFKSLFCSHDFSIKAKEYYGDSINYHNFYRSRWKCSKCGVESYSDLLYEYKRY